MKTLRYVWHNCVDVFQEYSNYTDIIIHDKMEIMPIKAEITSQDGSER